MKKLRKYHKWPSLVIGVFLLLFCTSGIIMNHRSIFASFDFPRWLMPGNYHYQNWNLASVKGFLPVNDHEMLAYGNTGIWKTNRDFSRFEDFNNGFPHGIDHRKIFTMVHTSNNRLFAGTLFGLFEWDHKAARWNQVELPEEDPRIVKILEKDNNLLVMSRSELWQLPLNVRTGISAKSFQHITIPPTEDHSGKAGMFRTFWVIHSGEIFGLTGKLIVDLVGLSVMFMTLTGFFYFFLPKFAKKIRDALRKRLQKLNRTTINWHTLLGVWAMPVLLVTVLTGMFLRPPLLIPIVNREMAAIPGTILATSNVWEDKLRDIVYDSVSDNYLISTSEGFITLQVKDGTSVSKKVLYQPPVSVMGINALEPMGNGEYLVASFSGIYNWNPHTGMAYDMITGQPAGANDEGRPFGSVAVAGVYMQAGKPLALLDYGAGWINLSPGLKPAMPEVIASQPISWWNLALEIHTGRIFEFLTGDFYILYVPLMGLTTLVILITGLLMYFKSRKRKKSKITSHGTVKSERSPQSTGKPQRPHTVQAQEH